GRVVAEQAPLPGSGDEALDRAEPLASPAVPDVLVYGDTVRSPELRHEVPLLIPDGFLYAERDGRRSVAVSSLEVPRVRELGGLEVLSWDELGWEELIAQGIGREELYLHVAARACRRIGVESAVVPAAFPVELADHLR